MADANLSAESSDRSVPYRQARRSPAPTSFDRRHWVRHFAAMAAVSYRHTCAVPCQYNDRVRSDARRKTLLKEAGIRDSRLHDAR